VIQACRQLAEINFEAMLEVSETAHERVQSAVYSAGAAAFGTLLVGLLVALNVSRRLSAPLQEIVAGTRRIAGGDYQVQVPPSSTRELDQLGRQFNAMARALQRFEAMNLERVLREQRQSEAVLQSIDDGLVIFSEDARISHLNPIAARQLGFDARACRDRQLGELLGDDGIDAVVRRCLGSAEDSGKPGVGELHIERAGGTRFLGYSVLPIIGEREQRQGAVMVIRDITEHKAFEQMRNEFVMRASHELRTPVTGIRMGIGMLAEKTPYPAGSRERELFDTVSEELDRLTLLVNDLFDLSRLQANRLPLTLQSSQIKALLDATLQRFTLEAGERQIELRLDAADDLPEVMLDPERFERVLDNLISNALRHTGEGGQVQLCAFADGGRMTIEISDTGCGIEYARQQRVFEPFVQASDTGDGAGLGLAICREIVHQHDGRITLRSTPGLGTTFRIDLPV
jgi:NtrC-family two-component system sensor histidine kinase KinB